MATHSRALALDRGGIAIGALFLGVAVVLSWNADASRGFGPDQAGYNQWARELLISLEQGLPAHTVFGSAYNKSFSILLAAGQLLAGDLTACYRLILLVSALAYLAAMYVMLMKVLDDRAVAALTSVLSIVQRYTVGTSFWGMGEFQAVLPRIVVLPVFPLAWLLFVRHPRSRRVLESFLVVAVGFVVHLSAVYFFCILMLTYALYQARDALRQAWRRVGHSVLNLSVAASLLCFAIVAVTNPGWSRVMIDTGPAAALLTLTGLGLVFYYSRFARHPAVAVVVVLYLGALFALLASDHRFFWQTAAGGNEHGDLEALNAAIYARFGWTLFPISGATLGFALFNGGIVGGVALWELVRRLRRGPAEHDRLAVSYMISVVAVSLGLTAALQLYCHISGRPYIVLELFRALRFMFLPIYIYLGLFLQRMWRRSTAPATARGRLLLAMLIVALLLPPRQTLAALPDGLKLMIRSVAESSRGLHQGDPSQRRYLRTLLATDVEIEAAQVRHRDFLELCDWVKRSTPQDAVFMTTDFNFTHHAERDIMISYSQGAPGGARSKAKVSGYLAWHEAFVTISSAYASRSPLSIMAAARGYGVDYVVTDAEQAPLPADLAHANASYAVYRMSPETRTPETRVEEKIGGGELGQIELHGRISESVLVQL